ncbi:MAG: hypothetical protein NTU47_15995 [Ignavibacteriales bacterium]|nr:hypothetical protein [Ignavibacteriales bacterium]
MRSRTTALMVSMILLSCAAAGMQDDAAKGNVRYAVRPEYTRLLVFFKGPLKYSQELRGNVLTLTVTDIKSALSQSGWNKQFRNGLIENASVEPVVNATSKIVMLLRNGYARFQVTQHDRHEAIWIDVFAKNTVAPAASIVANESPVKTRVAPTQTKEAKQSRPQAAAKRSQDRALPDDPHHPSPLFDIAALARQQLEDAGHPKAAGNAPAQANLTLQSSKSGSEPTPAGRKLLVWLVVAGFSLLTSIAALAILIKRKMTRANKLEQLLFASAQARSLQTRTPNDEERGEAAVPERSREERKYEFEPEERIERDGVPALTFAEQYHRNQGDVELAMRIRDNARTQGHLSVTRTIGTTIIPAKGRISAAKKLGVGKGELELASKLLRLSLAQKETEDAA